MRNSAANKSQDRGCGKRTERPRPIVWEICTLSKPRGKPDSRGNSKAFKAACTELLWNPPSANGFLSAGPGTPAHLSQLLIRAGDVELNPGPICDKQIKKEWNVFCNYGAWVHLKCTNLTSVSDYKEGNACNICSWCEGARREEDQNQEGEVSPPPTTMCPFAEQPEDEVAHTNRERKKERKKEKRKKKKQPNGRGS